jgi:hypothetical protein
MIIADSLFQCVIAGLILMIKKQNKTNHNEDSFSDALNYNHILKEYMSKKKIK